MSFIWACLLGCHKFLARLEKIFCYLIRLFLDQINVIRRYVCSLMPLMPIFGSRPRPMALVLFTPMG